MKRLKVTAFITVIGLSGNVTLCYAEKIAAPVLLKPLNAQKEVPKEQIILNWQKPTGSTPFGYRLIISENSRFNGYDPETDTCTNNCYLFLEGKDTLSEKVDVSLNNKIYYWKVQAFNTTEKGLWSAIQTFQTQKTPSIVLPSIKNILATPNSVFLGNSMTFSADLTTALPEKYSVKVDYGSGLIEMSGNGTAYKSAQSPTKTGMQTYTVGIYDANGTLKGTALTGNFEIVKLAPDPTPIPTPITTSSEKFNYTKISADGAELANTAREWACVRDNNTGLIWEVKTDDGGLHDKDSKYSWYNPTVESKGTFRSYEYQKWCTGSSCDTFGFMNAVNNQRLCGLNNWRIPEKEELMTLVYCSDGKYDDDDGECSSYQKVQRPTITTKYFSFTRDSSYWTNTQNIYGGAFYIGFDEGIAYSGSKSSSSFVRLVHDGN